MTPRKALEGAPVLDELDARMEREFERMEQWRRDRARRVASAAHVVSLDESALGLRLANAIAAAVGPKW